jgi:alcohol dehydrogenase YqhD (iron-dependent ADH family)
VNNFELYNPIRMIFGEGEFERLGECAGEYGSKPLVVFGKCFARECGLLDRTIEILKDAGLDPVVFEGVESNPRLATCSRAAKKAIENECDMVIGIGGGSVMDASKVIAFGFYDPDNMWRHIAHWEDDFEPITQALPIILVSTLAATGSEGDGGAVINHEPTNDKVGVFSEFLFPKASIIDPKLQMSTPMEYTRDGAVDMSIHVLESYFNGDPSAKLSDRITEGFFIEVLDALDAIMEDPEDMEARGQLAWLGAIALQGFINGPRGGTFPLHMMQHPLSAYYDISHGRGLALLLPRWMKYVAREKPDKFIQFGDRVFGMDLETHHPFEAVEKVIDRITEWLEDIGAWFFMDDLGIPYDPVMIEKMADDVMRVHGKDGYIEGLKPLNREDIVAIYMMCVRAGAPEETPVEEPSEEETEGEETAEETSEEAVADEAEATDKAEAGEEAEKEEIEVVEEVIELKEGEPLPEGVEGEDYIVVEEVVEEEKPES